ncbi:MAG: glycosyltransferase family 4 protein [Thermoleophilaceae bacterium]
MAAVVRGLLRSPLSDRYRLEAVATYRRPEPLRRVGRYCIGLARLVAWSLARRGRIVHVHATVRGSMYRKSVCVLVAKALRRRVVLHVHSGPGDLHAFRQGLGRGVLGLFRLAFRSADVVLAVSTASARALERDYGVHGIQVLPNAAPEVMPTPRSSVRTSASPGDVRFVYLGGFANPAKGGDVLLAALGRASGAGEGMRMTLAGPGELPRAGRELVARMSGVEWVGWLDDEEKDRLLRDADAFVLPSRSEGLPIALLEAMAHGLAIVATAVGGVPDVIVAERDGLIVPPEDSPALAAALSRLATDSELRGRLGLAAREQAERLDANSVAERLDALYAALL